jgi:transcriptional regulator with XRE-family HTH domain
MSFGQKLRDLREERNLSQAEVGKAVGVYQRHVSAWENGVNKPALENIMHLARFFGVSIDYLVFDNVPREGIEAINDFELYQKFRATEKLSVNDRKVISDMVDAFLFKLTVKNLTAGESATGAEQASSNPPALRKVAGKR